MLNGNKQQRLALNCVKPFAYRRNPEYYSEPKKDHNSGEITHAFGSVEQVCFDVQLVELDT